MINKKRLINLTRRLIQIDSQNPPGSEHRISAFVREYLKNLGLKTKIYAFKSGRSNVVAILKGKTNRRSLLITPHLDTVPAGNKWSVNPLVGKIKGGRIYGLGATDCKGNLAVALEVINSIVEERIILGYNLVFAATADEESGSHLGLIPLLKRNILKADAALVLDMDDFGILVAQKGLMHLKVKIEGKRAHGAYPELGINAIDAAIKIIARIRSAEFLHKYNPSRYLKAPTLNIGTIRGGDKVNVVADWCEFELDIRFLPGSSSKAILQDVERAVKKYAPKFKIEIEGIQQPYLIDRRHPLVTSLVKATRRFKVNPKITGSEGATVVTFFQDAQIPAVATGFGSGGCAHIADEYARINDLYNGALVLEEFLKAYKFSIH